MINILVVDRNINYCVKLLNNICTNNSNIRITNISRSIEDIYSNANSFDIILLDSKLFVSTKLDSFSKSFITKHKDSVIILIDNTIEGRKYSKFNHVLKYDLDNLLKKILEMSSTKFEVKGIKNKIKDELLYLGYNCNHLGTLYLSEIIYLIYCTDFEGSLEKKIYPYIAKKYKKTVNTIKCDIINATSLMFCECPEDKLIKYLGKYSYLKPGPKTIIYTIINKISA